MPLPPMWKVGVDVGVGLKIYDADQVSLIGVGIPIDSGYADGEFVKIEMADDAFKTKVGTDGEIVRSKTNNYLAKVTIRLMQTSDGNAKLSAVHELDKMAPNGKGVGPFMVRDRQGTSLHAGQYSWVTKAPDVTYDREATEREWELAVILDERLDGGN